MLRLFLVMILPLCILDASLAESSLKYQKGTDPLPMNHSFFKKNDAVDFWNLISYYVPQQDPSACGIASMSIVFNAMIAQNPKGSEDRILSQKLLLEKNEISYKRGLTLIQLKEALHKVFSQASLKATIDLVHVDGSTEQKKKIKQLLIENEKSSLNFLIANFNQGIYTGDSEGGGHISPVAAFDSVKNRVLILDVDREYYEPYWIDFDRFIDGMNTVDPTSGKNRGFVLIQKN